MCLRLCSAAQEKAHRLPWCRKKPALTPQAPPLGWDSPEHVGRKLPLLDSQQAVVSPSRGPRGGSHHLLGNQLG